MKNATGFHPTAKLQKILGNSSMFGACAYIHRDGIAIWQKKEIKIKGGNNTTIDVWHIVPCEIPITVRTWSSEKWGYSTKNNRQVDRIVVHDTTLIANGFDEIVIDFNSSSEASREKGIVINSTTFRNGSHVWHDTEIVGVYGSHVSLQPDNFNPKPDTSIRTYIDYSWRTGNSVIVYGDLPPVEESRASVTVDQ